MIHKAFRYRIYPVRMQKSQIKTNCGCSRYVYNYFRSMREQMYKMFFVTVSYNCCSEELTALKKDSDHLFLNDADSTALQSALRDLDDAYNRFFHGEAGYPKYRSKKDHIQRYTTKNNNGSIKVFSDSIQLPKLGIVKARISRPIEGRILRATVEATASGKYYVSILCECDDPKPLYGGEAVGIDLGLRDYAVLSDNLEHISNPEPLRKLLRRLAHEQRVLSRKTRGSHRYEKQRIKVAELHQRIRDFRNDFLQKLSTDLIRKYSIIGIEDLNVKHLLREGDTDTARRISDAGWNAFVSMLQYKADWYKRTLVKVGRYFPSSQICHDCGYRFPEVKTKRLVTWTCPKCGKVHQRDENASLNIRDEALRILAGVSA